jgi:hypothetical protein
VILFLPTHKKGRTQPLFQWPPSENRLCMVSGHGLVSRRLYAWMARRRYFASASSQKRAMSRPRRRWLASSTRSNLKTWSLYDTDRSGRRNHGQQRPCALSSRACEHAAVPSGDLHNPRHRLIVALRQDKAAMQNFIHAIQAMLGPRP